MIKKSPNTPYIIIHVASCAGAGTTGDWLSSLHICKASCLCESANAPERWRRESWASLHTVAGLLSWLPLRMSQNRDLHEAPCTFPPHVTGHSHSFFTVTHGIKFPPSLLRAPHLSRPLSLVTWSRKLSCILFLQNACHSCVFPGVLRVVTGSRKRPYIICTQIALTCVSTLMSSEVRLAGEGFPTFPTLIGFIACVSPPMYNELWLIVEISAALSTHIGACICVYGLMQSEMWLAVENFATVWARIWLLAYVSPLM